MIRLVLQNPNLDLEIRNEAGVNAFWIACMFGHGEVMNILADAGLDIMCHNHQGVNALHLSIKKNHIDIVKMLLSSGFPLDKETDEGFTAFHLASFHGREEIMQIMLENLEAMMNQQEREKIMNQVNEKTNIGSLSYAILFEHNGIAQLLIEAGAQCYFSGNDQQKDFSPIFVAV